MDMVALPNLRRIRTTTEKFHDEPSMKMSNDRNSYGGRDKKAVQATRGLRSLAMAVAVPVSLTLLTKYASFAGAGGRGADVYRAAKPFWFPPLWALHVACMIMTFVMGLSAWLVWAEGGFHRRPVALYMYVAQLGLSLAWDPIVFRFGANQVGLVVCLGMLGAVCGCAKAFREVNMIAGDLVKPCLAWAAILCIVSMDLATVST